MKNKAFKISCKYKALVMILAIVPLALFCGCAKSSSDKAVPETASAVEETTMSTEQTTFATTTATTKKKTTTTLATTTVTTAAATTVTTTAATTAATTLPVTTTTVATTAVVTTALPSVATTTVAPPANTVPITTTAATVATTRVTSNADFPYDNNTYEFMAEVVRLCNVERANEGLSALTLDPALTKASMIRANEIVTLFDHTRPDETLFYTVLDQIGYQYWTVGENIAAGQTTPAGVVSAWMGSPGHRANILDGEFTKIGIGYVCAPGDAYYHYWVQIFAG